jgi:plasmid stabilization system protein ParE
MIVRVVFRTAAEQELKEAYDWYEGREKGLGFEFLQAVEGCVQTIRRHPEIFPEANKNIRQGVLRRFPYSIFYLVEDAEIVVISVFHSSRDPSIWQRRF